MGFHNNAGIDSNLFETQINRKEKLPRGSNKPVEISLHKLMFCLIIFLKMNNNIVTFNFYL